ncbi:MAG: DNA mismatch repair endonuclease MutL [Candidatus Kryptoniota bacterium]
MAKVKILSEEIASKIAAGEVVQRPESVVKELVENAIDAHAQHISIIIKDAGKSFISVEDDGVGMSEDDAVLCFERHATSKINTYEDLINVSTLGFRGEALYSIAAVAQVELKTKTASDELGTYVRVEGGGKREISKIGRDVGTSVIVKNLFFNTPARRSFLRQNSTEFRHIYQTVSHYAISFPEIKFTLESDGEVVLKVSSSTVKGRLGEIFGEAFAETLVHFEDEFDHLHLSGFLGKPDYTKRTRGEQLLFLNRRYVVNKAINHAVFSGYENLLEKGNFPFYAIFIKIPPDEVDVNVHPSKLEVKFSDERSIYGAVRSTVRAALIKSDLVPEITIAGDSTRLVMRTGSSPFRGGFVPVSSRSGGEAGLSRDRQISFWSIKPGGENAPDMITAGKMADAVEPLFSIKVPQPVEVREQSTHGSPRISGTEVLYQLHNKYIISQISTGLLVVDQHAAHERVLYEKALNRFNDQGQYTQQLLFPLSLNINPSDFAVLQEINPGLSALGFNIKLFSGTTAVLDGVPVDLKAGRESTIISEIIEDYKRDNDLRLTPREKLCKTYACKAAVKAGDYLSADEMEALLDQLFATRVPYVCPHGRPVLIKIPLLELDKKFGRI